MEIVLPWLRWRWRKKAGARGPYGNNSVRPEFDVSDEYPISFAHLRFRYLELLYRQFIIYLGMPVFPLITAIGLILNYFKFYLDKFRMIKVI